MNSPLRIGIAGLGTVGAATASILQESADLLAARCAREMRLTAVSARDRSRDRGFRTDGLTWYEHAVDMAADPALDIVVELIGGSEGVAYDLVKSALQQGKHVVTANKALIAHHGMELATLAEEKGVALWFEAAVAGGIPILKAIREGFAANRITRVVGILNGTCNFILDQMQLTQRGFAEVLKEAQELGYAEADPTFDVDGIDTAHKLAILTSLAYGVTTDLESVSIEGIRHITYEDIEYAQELGYRIKLLGIARPTPDGIEQRVHPCMVKESQPMARIPDAYNAVELAGDQVGPSLLEGKGAGGGPTASAVVADLVDIARGHVDAPFGVPVAALGPMKPAPMDAHEGAYYLRLSVIDEPGVLAAVSNTLYEEGISLESCIQRGHAPGETVQLALITHPTRESAMQQALGRISALNAVQEPPHMIRIEPL